MVSEINAVLENFSPIALDEMDGVRLMNRVDTKFLTTEFTLLDFLRFSSPGFRVVEIDGCRRMPYSTCYYDTSDCIMYREHERGRATRQKIRVREYEDTGTRFLEVKRKNSRGRTDKKRIGICPGTDAAGNPLPFPDSLADFSDFIRAKSFYSAADLLPRIRNRFHRITLVNGSMTERLTIDTGIEFRSLLTGNACSLDGLAVIELKRDGRLHSGTADILHSLHIHPSGFSKYCIGMAMTDPFLRQHNFKLKIRLIRKLLN